MNQKSEEKARDIIDKKLDIAGWIVQDNAKMDFSAGIGIYLLTVNRVVSLRQKNLGLFLLPLKNKQNDMQKVKLQNSDIIQNLFAFYMKPQD